MAKEEMKYEQAVRELEQIVERMENDELDIDQLSEQLKRAKTLVKLCKDKLTKTDEEIKKLLSEDWQSPLVSVDLQSAASYLFRICNPLQVTAQERKSTSFGGFQIRKEIGRTFFVCGFQIRRNAYGGLKPPLVSVDLQSAAVQERLRRIEAPACFGGFAIRRQLPIPVSADLQSAAVQVTIADL